MVMFTLPNLFNRQIDRQTDRQRERQVDRLISRNDDRLKIGPTGKQTNSCSVLGPVVYVRRVDNFIQRINPYPVDKICSLSSQN